MENTANIFSRPLSLQPEQRFAPSLFTSAHPSLTKHTSGFNPLCSCRQTLPALFHSLSTHISTLPSPSQPPPHRPRTDDLTVQPEPPPATGTMQTELRGPCGGGSRMAKAPHAANKHIVPCCPSPTSHNEPTVCVLGAVMSCCRGLKGTQREEEEGGQCIPLQPTS